MTDTKFTPGPWAYRPDKHDDWGTVRGPKTDSGALTFICQAKDPRFLDDDFLNECRTKKADPWAANAHLIAAAPELYEALRALKNEVSGLLEAFEGELREIGGNSNFHCICLRVEQADEALAKARGEQ